MFWRIWCKALGEKSSACNSEADRVAWIRTLLVIQAVTTNFFIIFNIIHNW